MNKVSNNMSKTDQRNTRLVRLYVLSEAYYRYQIFYLNQCVLNNNTTYSQAENTSMLINTIFNGKTTPADFIKSENDTTNELIEKYKAYQSYLNKNILDKAVVDAFCKATEHNFGSILKINSTAFTSQIIALILYNKGQISKQQAQEKLVDYCIFSRKTKKLNTVLFKRTIHSIEKLYQQILIKKTSRQLKNTKL